MKIKPFILALVIIGWVNTAFATTFYVAKTGNDSNSGLSTSAPKLTIAGCVAVMSGGDTCQVRAGTYHESLFLTLPSGFAGSPTTIKGYPGDAVPTMVGDLTLGLENYILWDGVNIDGTGDNDTADCVLINSGHDITITHADIANCQRHGILTGDGNGASISNLVFSYLTVHNTGQGYLTSPDPRHHNFYIAATNFTTGPITIDHVESYNTGNPANAGTGGPSGSAANSWGIQIYAATPGFLSGVTVSNCYVHDNNQGIVIGSGTGHKIYNTIVAHNYELNGEGAIQVSYGSPVDIEILNNTITDNVGYAIELGLFSSPTGTIIKNNIIYANDHDTILDHGSSGTVSTPNLLATNPSFVSASTHDYHLQSGSAARGIGTNLYSTFTADKDGTTRASSGAWDDGAYVFSGGGGGGGGTPPPNPPTVPPAPQNLHLLP